jgi:hypothetical protein
MFFGLLKNFSLNLGGILGAITFVVTAIAFISYFLHKNGRLPPGGARAIVVAAVIGSLFGNWLWRLAFGSDNWEPPQQFQVIDEDRKR